METIATDLESRVVLVAAGEAVDRCVFFFAFPIDAPDHLAVLVDGLAADPRPIVTPWPNAPGGTVTFADPLPQGAVLVLERAQPIARPMDLSSSTGVSAGQVNAEFNLVLRHLSGLAGRARQRLGADITLGSDAGGLLPGPAGRAAQAVGFDADGALLLRSRADQKGFTGEIGPLGPSGAMRGVNNLAELTDATQARDRLDLPSRAGFLAALTDRQQCLRRLALQIVANSFLDAARRDMARLSLVDGLLDLLADTDGIDLVSSSGMAHDGAGDFLSNETEGGVGQAFTLRSLPVEQEDTPETAHLLLLLEPVDPLPEPDDLTLRVSRTGGLDWTDLPAPESWPFSDGISLFASGPVSLAAQPDGNALVWQLSSTLAARRRVHGWALLWA